MSNEGRPLPQKPGIEQFPADPRRTREMVPTKGSDVVDIFNGSPQARDAARIRQIERARLADWWKRRTGKPATEAELDEMEGGARAVREGLAEGGTA